MESNTLWKVINKYFEENPQYLVAHHIESYNDFFHKDIFEIFKNKNPIQLVSAKEERTGEYKHRCNLYLGGRDGRLVYFGKPMIHDGSERGAHYMYPNEARLRNMTYAMTVHYDVEVEFIDVLAEGEAPYVVGPEFLTDEEIAKLGGIVGGGLEEWDVDYTAEFQEEARNTAQNYKIDGGEAILLNLETGVGGAKSDAEADKNTTGKARREKRAQSERRVSKLTTAISTAIKEAQAKSVSSELVQRRHVLLKKLYLGKIPIMVQSDFCVLNGMTREMRHSFGECRNDPGGYFIINGKEKTIAVQEKFGDNMLYIHKGRPAKDKADPDIETDDDYLYSAEIRSVSENVAKPKRTLSVKLMAPTKKYTNRNLVVFIPNVRAPVPLFILFRALGVLSDKDIISMCVLDLDKYDFMLDLFEPSIHDAGPVMQQHMALEYIGELTKFQNEKYALEILTDYFLPHVGETNYMDKAYYLGYMVFRLLCSSQGLEPTIDRDNLKYKRLEPFGTLFNDLFQEYYSAQQKFIMQEFDRRINLNISTYEHDLPSLIFNNYREIFGNRLTDDGIKKAFKGGWGGQAHTKRVGIVQDLNRLSFNATLCHLRKINLPLDSSSKIVGPRILHNSHWGYFDFIDTPDGANIGLHKTFAMTAYMTRGYSREHIIKWMRERVGMRSISDCTPLILSTLTKVFVNGHWAGAIDRPIECVSKMRVYRRNGLIPLHTSIAFNIRLNTVEIYTDAGRFTRPIFYKDDISGKWPFLSSKMIAGKIESGDFTWEELVSGFNAKLAGTKFAVNDVSIKDLDELYSGVAGEKEPTKLDRFLKEKAVIEYIDPNETEHSLIAQNWKDWENNADKHGRYTHMEIHHAFLFGIMCNQSIFAETNPAARVSFSCSQGRQACSIYHSNFHCRMDKTAIVLNYGQTPLLKTRLLQHIDREEHPCGENVIVAIMCYTGYNVEDAILVNEGSIKRGMFNTTYYTTYTEREERKRGGQGGGESDSIIVDKRFTNVEAEPRVIGLKPAHDYSKLDSNGLIRENTPVDDKTIIIGYTSNSAVKPDVRVDASKTTKKGQLGIVDKAFITEGEEGERIAKVRIREVRIPNLGDKMASRAGQKGVVGLVIPEKDMPFTKDGLKPDLIINPHALPTRQTIGHLVECLMGKVSTMYGGFSDCTAFNNEGSKAASFGRLLPEVGFHSSGHDILYNGMTGEQIETEIFIGPNYYMRLKHMVKDKINYRALGPRTALTKQPVSGRANDGGLRIGEMERDSVIGHGINEFLRESMMERGDKYQMVVCNTTGTLAVYNPTRDLFMSPMADGPLKFFRSETGAGYALDTMTKYGRRFSVVSVPYSLKLLMQELAAINVQLRIITEDNLQQIESMAKSDNWAKLSLDSKMTPKKFADEMLIALRSGERALRTPQDVESPPKLVAAERDENSLEDERINTEYNAAPAAAAAAVEATSPAYQPSESSATENATSPDYLPSPEEEEPKKEEPKSLLESVGSALGLTRGGGANGDSVGGSYSVDDFQLGENVFFNRSVDLGFDSNQVWTVARKGGRLLTLTTQNRSGFRGGNRGGDPIQIAKLDEVAKIDEYMNYQQQRAGTIQAQMMAQQQQQQQMPMMNGGGFGSDLIPGSQQQPTINVTPVIKLVGGNDYSKNEGLNADDSLSGGGNANSNMDMTFSNLVIPKMGGGGGSNNAPTAKSSDNTAASQPSKSILGGLAELVINKMQ